MKRGWRASTAFALGVLLAFPAVGVADEPFGRGWAVVVGIRDYRDATRYPTLEYAVQDADAIGEYLAGQGFEVLYLRNAEATRVEIIGVLEDEIAPRLKDGDRVLVFFSGHGETKSDSRGNDTGYIVPWDGSSQSGSWISMDELHHLSEKLGRARHQLFIMDSCYGGSLATKTGPVEPKWRNPEVYRREATRRPARQFLTAGGQYQQVLAVGPHGFSYFTGFLLEALRDGHGDLDGDGYIFATELYGYLRRRALNDYQVPGIGELPGHGLGDFLVSFPPGGLPLDATLPPPRVRVDDFALKAAAPCSAEAPPWPDTYDTAVDALEKCLKQKKNRPKEACAWGPLAHRMRQAACAATAEIEAGRWGEVLGGRAEGTFSEPPRFPYYYLGLVYFRSGELSAALEWWRESERRGVIERDPDRKKALLHLIEISDLLVEADRRQLDVATRQTLDTLRDDTHALLRWRRPDHRRLAALAQALRATLERDGPSAAEAHDRRE